MLKALELVGFKSFADKTRFEFPSGITAVVGPNGSGKSNVVDAIKWVLGEQSVKSLRGKEMVDVIFNGSAGRPPLNTAEATLVFDNAERRLAVDTPEVFVTRRVYRSGEAEYLLNRQPCRLRDIRELFAGTGAATEAYSVIEQGKVDVMLQASAKDRRLIFEEAAGISRFKAKKVETLRRLERVDQNLLRLSDIVDEVGNRLRSVRMQATKARRYKEYADRLQELRTQTAQADWRRLGERLKQLEGELATLAIDRDAALSEAQQLENRALGVEAEMAELLARQRLSDGRAADNRERIAAREALLDDQHARLHEAAAEEIRLLRQLAALRVRAGDSDQQLADSNAAVEHAQQEQQALQQSLNSVERDLAAAENEFKEFRGEFDTSRATAQDAAQAVAACESEAASLAARREAAQAAAARRAEELSVVEQAKAEAEIERGSLAEVESQLAASLDRQHADWLAAQQALVELQGEQRAKLLELSQLRQRHAAASERAALLEELEARQEGLGAGAKSVLASLRDQHGPLKSVRGMVADLVRVPVEFAPAVEAALAEQAQAFVVVPDSQFLDWAQHASSRLPSRIGFVWTRADEPALADDFKAQPGVHGRADRLVEAPADLATLVRQLLGHTWIVNTLADALRLAEHAPRGVAFATLAGEVVTSNRTLSVGPKLAATGVISRRAELRALHEQTTSLDARIAASQSDIETIEQRLAELAEAERQESAAHQRAADVLVEHRLRLNAAEVRRTQLVEQLARLAAEVGHEEDAVRSADEALRFAESKLGDLKRRQAELESSSQGIRNRLRLADERLAAEQQRVTEAKVALAKCEERLTSLSTHLAQLRRDQLERRRSVDECREQLVRNRQAQRQIEQSLLAAESELAGLYLLRESLAVESAEHVAAHDRQRAVRAEFQAAAQTSQTLARTLEQQRHAQDLVANEVRHERTTLAARMRDDYQIDLAQREADVSPEAERERAEVDQEIAELRRKINHIGTVNLDALAELEELEKRHTDLSAQFQDLTQAKDSLLAIINNINADSRRLFADTLQAVTANFQALFRKLFGGGQADVVLEEGIDVLDSGIEIVARPPGKELRSISLLSGGEKTLTCVALLLAIFQYRPSPFCVLDEVDAALDEANIERFASVLQEFLAWTQFIIITHSKKTMTCAGTLYGVTMEESGVSKRVSVRFEDVSEDGQIRTAAARMRESA